MQIHACELQQQVMVLLHRVYQLACCLRWRTQSKLQAARHCTIRRTFSMPLITPSSVSTIIERACMWQLNGVNAACMHQSRAQGRGEPRSEPIRTLSARMGPLPSPTGRFLHVRTHDGHRFEHTKPCQTCGPVLRGQQQPHKHAHDL